MFVHVPESRELNILPQCLIQYALMCYVVCVCVCLGLARVSGCEGLSVGRTRERIMMINSF